MAAEAAAASWVTVERRSAGYALVTLRREPVNTMSLAFWRRLDEVLDELEADPQVRGVIFCSGLKRDVFTAGNDIRELYAPLTSAERYCEFWVLSNRFLARLYASPLATLAAIRGACPAGGCCLSMCCDYRLMTEAGSIGHCPAGGCGLVMCCDRRLMTEAGSIGLNEVALGISVPKMWAGLMARIIGLGPAEKLLQFAVMLSPAEAKDVGLIDDVAPRDGLLAAAEETMAQMLQAPDVSRARTKRQLREDYAAEWAAYCEVEAAGAWEQLASPPVVAQLGAILERLGGRKGGGGGAPPSRL